MGNKKRSQDVKRTSSQVTPQQQRIWREPLTGVEIVWTPKTDPTTENHCSLDLEDAWKFRHLLPKERFKMFIEESGHAWASGL